MKSVSAALLNLIPNPKSVNARATFRLNRPTFTTSAVAGSVTDPALVDTNTYSTGLLQVTNIAGKLNYRFISDINAVWPAWTDSGISIFASSRPGVSGQYIWYQLPAGDICWRDYTNLAVENSAGMGIMTATTLAPITNLRCYAMYHASAANIAYIRKVSATGLWSGRVFNTTDMRLDAVTINNPLTGRVMDYLYFMDRDAGRIMEMSCEPANSTFGEPHAVVPIDAIDDVYGLKLHHATPINGSTQVALTARLTRTSDAAAVGMDVYLIGPENFSMGRDMFISDQEVGGKLSVVGNVLISSGSNKKAQATCSNSFGVDDASLKTVVSDIINLRLTEAEGRSSFLTMELSPALSHAAIAPGAEVTFEFSYGSEWMTAFTGEVDSVKTTQEEGQSLVVSIISKTMKRLGQWAPDQGVYIPSQATLTGYADDLSKMIRGQGKFTDGTNSLSSADFNTWDVLYTAARATKNGLMRARFYNELAEDRTTRNPRFGVGLGYYRETAAMAAARLNVDPSTIKDDQLGHNGLVAVYSRTEYDATHSGLALYSWVNSVMTQLTKVSVDLPHVPTWIELQMMYRDGYVRVDYRAHPNANWVNILTYNLPDAYAWMVENGGHGCILMMRQLLKSSEAPPIAPDDKVIPVLTNTPFLASGTLLVEDEQIAYTTKSAYNYPVYDGAAYNYATGLYQPAYKPGDTAFSADFPWAIRSLPAHIDNYYASAAAVLYHFTTGVQGFHVHTLRVTANDPSSLTPWYWGWMMNGGAFGPGWKNDINNTAAGSWVQNPISSISYVFLDQDPAGIMVPDGQNTGSPAIEFYKLWFFPCLYGVTRGSSSTVAASHGDPYWNPTNGSSNIGATTVYQYYAIDLRVTNFEFYTADEDISLADALKRMLVQAGGNASAKYEVNTARTIPAATWDVVQVASHTLPDFIAEIDIPLELGDGFGVGMVFYSAVPVAATPATGYFVKVYRSGTNLTVDLLKNGTTLVFTSVVDTGYVVGTLKISAHSSVFSVWLNHVYLTSFTDTTLAANTYKAFVAYNPSLVAGKSVTYRLSELDDLLADITVGVRGKGPNVLSELLGDRAVYFRTEPDGSMFFYRNPTDASTLPDIVAAVQSEDTDSRVSRLRAEGVKVVEVADFTALSGIGNIFETINSQYGNNVAEITMDANAYLTRLKQHSSNRVMATVIHPALQPGDSGTFTLPEGNTALQIVSTDMMLGFQGDNFTADMQIQAFKP